MACDRGRSRAPGPKAMPVATDTHAARLPLRRRVVGPRRLDAKSAAAAIHAVNCNHLPKSMIWPIGIMLQVGGERKLAHVCGDGEIAPAVSPGHRGPTDMTRFSGQAWAAALPACSGCFTIADFTLPTS